MRSQDLSPSKTDVAKRKKSSDTDAHIPHGTASDVAHIVLTFDENALASQLFGQYDEHVAMLEQVLGVRASTRGNEIEIKGDNTAVSDARTALEALYDRLLKGESIDKGDVDGALRIARAPDSQLDLPAVGKKPKLAMAEISTRKKTVRARSGTQDAYIRAMQRAELVFGIGPAGTGKTYLAVAHAAALLERGIIDRIVLTRPAVEAGERLGFLPGDMKEKVDPYLRPLYDALYDMIPAEQVEKMLAADTIEIAPLAFMRGRTLGNAVVILDEAQNTTTMQMKMFLTRLGENGRMIVTGDPSQIDLPRGVKSGLVEALDVLQDVDGIVQVKFKQEDVVRHPLVAKIVGAYDKVYAENPRPEDRPFRRKNGENDQ
jgi:phosphate starvation-inducible PhoH-like protein